MNPFIGILVFSLIETVTVIAWFAALKSNNVVAAVILFVGYVIEHVVALNVSKGRPWFSWPRI